MPQWEQMIERIEAIGRDGDSCGGVIECVVRRPPVGLGMPVFDKLEADLAKAQVNMGYTRITAPMDGTVVNIPVQQGQTVIAVQITPVMVSLAQMDVITVRARVPEADVHAVKVGQVAKFSTL